MIYISPKAKLPNPSVEVCTVIELRNKFFRHACHWDLNLKHDQLRRQQGK